MSTDRIPEDRLFQNNTRDEISRWCKSLKYFHYLRHRGGHNCEGDSFSVYFKYADRNDLLNKLKNIGIHLKPLQEGDISFDPTQSYSLSDLDRLKITITHFNDLEQPQHVDLFGRKAHIWVLPHLFEISVSGTNSSNIYRVSDEDFKTCLFLENEFNKLNWASIADENIKNQPHCISEDKYPELYL